MAVPALLLAALLLAAPALAAEPAAMPPEIPAEVAPAPPRPVPPQRFRSPEEGFAALAAALAGENRAALRRVVGDAGMRLVAAGDRETWRSLRDLFLQAYAEARRVERVAPGEAILLVGPGAWPLPLPLRESGGAWRFDAGAASRDLLDRRIGRNELDVIETLRAIADAQAEFAAAQPGLRAYARRFFSTPGARDGLYWPTGPGEPPSPLGPLLAAASAGLYGQGEAPRPYRGYLFRILTRAGPNAPGGAMEWEVGGRLIGGFAVLAWPAARGVTGWTSFLVSHDGVVWEADLGPGTAAAARAITAFDPGPGWRRVAP